MGTRRPSSPVIPSDLAGYLDELVRRLGGHAGDRLIGIYLHGSAAMGAFVPSRSDVDVLVVTDGPITADTKRKLAEELSTRTLPCPGVGLELAVVDAGSFAPPSDAPRFELQLDAHDGHPERVIDGAGHDGDPDLVAHFAMARDRGLALFGPPPMIVLPSIDRERLLRAFSDDLGWGLEHGHHGYAVLNACRALRFAREGVLSSKPEGGAWAIENGVGDRASIEQALRRQAGGDVEVDAAPAEAFVEDVRRELGS